MFSLNGGGSGTGFGRVEESHEGKAAIYNYGYDWIRSDGAGGTYLTFHNRSDITYFKRIVFLEDSVFKGGITMSTATFLP